jgi:uncharacterized integral membrane protein (TIGR00697 family)
MNELLFFVTIVMNFVGILLAYKFFGKMGLFSWIALATVIANIEVTKCVDMFGMSLTLGNVIYGSTFLATDMLSELYGGAEARRGVLTGFFAMVAFTLMSQVNLLFEPNSQDFVSDAMKTIFSLTPRLCVASMGAYLVSNLLDTYSYDWIKKRFPRQLWLRNNGSTMTSQLVDSFLFTFAAFYGVFDMPMLIELSFTTYLIKVLTAACDTPFMYAAKKMGVK